MQQDWLYFFYPGFLSIKLEISRNPECLFAFRLMHYLLGLFHWGACRMSKLGAISKKKTCKINRIVWEMHAMWCFVLSFCEWMHAWVPTAHSVRQSFGGFRCNEWAVGTRAYNPKLGIACISHTIWSILQLFLLDFTPNLLTLHAPQWNNPITNKASFERQINRLSRDIKPDE